MLLCLSLKLLLLILRRFQLTFEQVNDLLFRIYSIVCSLTLILKISVLSFNLLQLIAVSNTLLFNTDLKLLTLLLNLPLQLIIFGFKSAKCLC